MGTMIWAARGYFEEKEKGSLEAGKFADFVIPDQDLRKAKQADLFKVEILKTYVNGENVYAK